MAVYQEKQTPSHLHHISKALELFESPAVFNGNFRILNWRYVSAICLAIFCEDIPLHRPEK